MVSTDTERGGAEQDPWIVAEDLTERLPGVDDVVITAHGATGEPVEIQVLSDPEVDRRRLREQVTGVIREVTRHTGPMRVIVLELAEPDATSDPGRAEPTSEDETAEQETERQTLVARTTTQQDGAGQGAGANSDTETYRTGPGSSSGHGRIELLGGERPVLVAADVRRHGEVSRATVLLTVGDREVTGAAERPPTAHDLSAVAEATLDAVRGAAATPRGLGLRGAALAEMLEGRVVCVRLSREQPTDRELFGAALIEGDDPAAATARATLDALNRQL